MSGDQPSGQPNVRPGTTPTRRCSDGPLPGVRVRDPREGGLLFPGAVPQVSGNGDQPQPDGTTGDQRRGPGGCVMATWFTADQHFGHKRIIELSGRPFGSVEEMNEAVVDRWNAVVAPDDLVWVLGDFALGRIGESV